MNEEPLSKALLLMHDVLRGTTQSTAENRLAILGICQAVLLLAEDLAPEKKTAIHDILDNVASHLEDEQH